MLFTKQFNHYQNIIDKSIIQSNEGVMGYM